MDSQFQERGSGLGLFISQTIINDLKGTIGVVSQEGRGSSFIIELPDVTFFEEEDSEGETDFEFFGDTVLIADDEAVNIMLYKAFLSDYNLKILTAEDGLKLIELAKKEEPKLIITDFNMPLLKGDKILEILRAEKIEVPVLLISAVKGDSIPISDFDGFLQKPVEEQVLLKEISHFLDHKVYSFEKEKEKDSIHFKLSKKIKKEEKQLILKIHEQLKIFHDEMDITDISIKVVQLMP